MTRPLVLVTETIEPEALAWLGERCEVVQCPPDDPGFEELLSKADGMVVRTYTLIDEGLLARGSNLKVIGRAGVALDNFDLDACAARGVRVVHTPGANTRAVVEYVTALMLDALRPRPRVDGPMDLDRWNELRAAAVAPRQASDLTLGILGLGRIGKGMARVARALDMRALYNDLLEMDEADRAGAQPVSPETLFAESDILTIHIDTRPENRHFVGERLLSRCKDDALIINASRGMVVDHDALASFLRAHERAQAILDVHEPEPVAPGSPMLGVVNRVLLPHIGAATRTAHANMSLVVEDVWRVLQGEQPEWSAV